MASNATSIAAPCAQPRASLPETTSLPADQDVLLAQTSTRRRLFVGGLATAMSSAAPQIDAGLNPDSRLVAIGRQLDRFLPELRRLYHLRDQCLVRAREKAMKDASWTSATDVERLRLLMKWEGLSGAYGFDPEPLSKRLDRLCAKAASLRATTLAGLAVKARLIGLQGEGVSMDELRSLLTDLGWDGAQV